MSVSLSAFFYDFFCLSFYSCFCLSIYCFIYDFSPYFLIRIPPRNWYIYSFSPTCGAHYEERRVQCRGSGPIGAQSGFFFISRVLYYLPSMAECFSAILCLACAQCLKYSMLILLYQFLISVLDPVFFGLKIIIIKKTFQYIILIQYVLLSVNPSFCTKNS